MDKKIDLKLCNEKCKGKWPCLFHENHFLPKECPYKEIHRTMYCKSLKHDVGYKYFKNDQHYEIIEIVPQGEMAYYRVKWLNPDGEAIKWAESVGHTFIYNTDDSGVN